MPGFRVPGSSSKAASYSSRLSTLAIAKGPVSCLVVIVLM
jgi:hypothetical protein